MNEYELEIFHQINDLDLEYCALCEILAKIVSQMYSRENEALKYIKIMGDLL